MFILFIFVEFDGENFFKFKFASSIAGGSLWFPIINFLIHRTIPNHLQLINIENRRPVIVILLKL